EAECPGHDGKHCGQDQLARTVSPERYGSLYAQRVVRHGGKSRVSCRKTFEQEVRSLRHRLYARGGGNDRGGGVVQNAVHARGDRLQHRNRGSKVWFECRELNSQSHSVRELRAWNAEARRVLPSPIAGPRSSSS